MNLRPQKCPHCGTLISPITKLREKLGIAQHQLAARLGVAQGNISRWESGTEPMGEARDMLVDLCRKYRIAK